MAHDVQTLYMAGGLLVVVAALAALVLYTLRVGRSASVAEAPPAAAGRQQACPLTASVHLTVLAAPLLSSTQVRLCCLYG